MRTPLYGVDIVDERIDVFIERCVVGERHFDGDTLTLSVQMNHIVDEALLVRVDVLHELAEALARIEHFTHGIAVLVERTLVGQCQRDAGIEECQIAQTVGQSGVVVNGDGENGVVGMECDGGSGGIGLAHYTQIARGLAA